MTKTPREALQQVFLEGIADGGTGGSMEDVVSKAAAEIKEAVLAAVGEDEVPTIPINDYYWRIRNEYRHKLRKAILTMFEGE